MTRKRLMLAASLIAILAGGDFAQQDEKLGKASFPTSCDPNVQAEFERGVAMLHSYWFRRFGANPDKKIVDRQAVSPSSWKTPFIATSIAW
jgi:hypothetical protein